jgi:hypothetical protein
MSTKRTIFTGLILAATAVFSFSSCNKCVVPEEDEYVGTAIKSEAIIYPEIGYIAETMNGNYHVTVNSENAENFQVDVNGDGNRVDYETIASAFDIVGLPMKVNCKAQFVRSLDIDPANQAATYRVDATTCTSCENMRIVENWVLVEKIPSSYIVYYDGNISEQ